MLQDHQASRKSQDASTQTDKKLEYVPKDQASAQDPTIPSVYINKLKKKIRHYMKIINKYRGFLDELRHDYSMPSELIGNIEDMQVNDSIQLMSSYVQSNVDVDSGLYDNTFDDGKTENTFDLLEYDYSKELKSIKQNTSGDTTNKPPVKIHQRMQDLNSHKTNSFFNYIKKVDTRKGNKPKYGYPNASFGKSSRIDDSESFHYDPRAEEESKEEKVEFYPNTGNLGEENDRSLSLPKFDTFAAVPQIKNTAEFHKLEKALPTYSSSKETPRMKIDVPDKGPKWDYENIEVTKEPQIHRDDSMMDSFLLEIASDKPNWKSTEVRAKKPTKKSRNKQLKFQRGKE